MTAETFHRLLASTNFSQNGETYTKQFAENVILAADFAAQKLHYPPQIKINRETTTNFSAPKFRDTVFPVFCY